MPTLWGHLNAELMILDLVITRLDLFNGDCGLGFVRSAIYARFLYTVQYTFDYYIVFHIGFPLLYFH